MKKLDEVTIRNDLRPGDLGEVIQLHGKMYAKEYGWGVDFETYVAKGLLEFWRRYDPKKDRVWVCEHGGKMVGFLLLMHRGKAAQLRYFTVLPEFRGIGLGKKLIDQFMASLGEIGYSSAYLWTTSDLKAAAALYARCGFVLAKEKRSNAFGRAVVEQQYVFHGGSPKKGRS